MSWDQIMPRLRGRRRPLGNPERMKGKKSPAHQGGEAVGPWPSWLSVQMGVGAAALLQHQALGVLAIFTITFVGMTHHCVSILLQSNKQLTQKRYLTDKS